MHFKSDEEEGVDAIVNVVSVNPETNSKVLNIVKTITTGRGNHKVTRVVADRTWRRAARGTPDPVWEMQASDGTFHPVFDRSLVDWEVRITWIRHVTSIKKATGILKKKKSFVDATDYDKWREKMRQATEIMN